MDTIIIVTEWGKIEHYNCVMSYVESDVDLFIRTVGRDYCIPYDIINLIFINPDEEMTEMIYNVF